MPVEWNSVTFIELSYFWRRDTFFAADSYQLNCDRLDHLTFYIYRTFHSATIYLLIIFRITTHRRKVVIHRRHIKSRRHKSIPISLENMMKFLVQGELNDFYAKFRITWNIIYDSVHIPLIFDHDPLENPWVFYKIDLIQFCRFIFKLSLISHFLFLIFFLHNYFSLSR